MNAETRAKELANAMARHIIGENFAAGDETCAECVVMVLKAITRAENDKLEEAARVAENPGFIQARDTEWDMGVNYAKPFIANAIRALKKD